MTESKKAQAKSGLEAEKVTPLKKSGTLLNAGLQPTQDSCLLGKPSWKQYDRGQSTAYP
jgi:hypothetical protein